eukprot:CAMPEP_0183735004 /NCGR_PEP_ID=MMETSP0737-20130205/45415_1 /TAXON_ID=385413 /ORGANISM="Thalassiosira miniscula, Strain CCMP1093" /LENGTH=392 /DNA_ID=CAMNT_0025968643 /DNA_START=781 /DNA_END=1959 /DNA_ORIENTATION=+
MSKTTFTAPMSSPFSPPVTNSTKDRVYCMVPFIWRPENMKTYHAIRDTWGKRCDIIKFFIDPIIGIGDEKNGNVSVGVVNLISNVTGPFNTTEGSGVGVVDTKKVEAVEATLPDDVVVLRDVLRPWHECGMEDCRNIWEKIWRSILWVFSHGDSQLAEWFVKVDSDSYLFPENLKHYINEKGLAPTDHHYFGHKLWHTDRPRQAPIIAGCTVVLSRLTMMSLAVTFRSFIPQPANKQIQSCNDAHLGQGEEIVFAVCLKQFNVSAEPALDSNGKELVSIFNIGEALGMTPSNVIPVQRYFWKKKPATQTCCGNLPIAFHGSKDPQFLYQIEDEIYGAVDSSYTPTIDCLKLYGNEPNRTIRYFEEVRSEMNMQRRIFPPACRKRFSFPSHDP